jgi:D-alanyl-D-alanine carboxypeptidase (penicillin-binding protein 5/6)
MKRLMNYGFNETTNKVFYKPGDKIVEIPVWYGRKKTVIATVEKPFAITLPRGSNATGLRILVRYEDPLPAPVRQGDKIGEIIAEQNGQVVARAPLVARERVGKIQFIARIIKNISVIINGR